jgi:hypothetical protein
MVRVILQIFIYNTLKRTGASLAIFGFQNFLKKKKTNYLGRERIIRINRRTMVFRKVLLLRKNIFAFINLN